MIFILSWLSKLREHSIYLFIDVRDYIVKLGLFNPPLPKFGHISSLPCEREREREEFNGEMYISLGKIMMEVNNYHMSEIIAY